MAQSYSSLLFLFIIIIKCIGCEWMMTFMQLFCFHIGCQNHTQNLVYFVLLAGDNVGTFYPNNNSMNQFDWWYEMHCAGKWKLDRGNVAYRNRNLPAIICWWCWNLVQRKYSDHSKYYKTRKRISLPFCHLLTMKLIMLFLQCWKA